MTNADRQVLEFLVDHRTPWFDTVMRLATDLGSFTVLTIVCVAFGIAWRVGRGNWNALMALAVVAFVGWFSSTMLKSAVARDRPAAGFRIGEAHGYSFPSGHATDAAALWVTLAVLASVAFPAYRRWFIATSLAVAAVVGISRMYLGVHWFTDVLGGWTLGLAIAAVAARAIQRQAGPADDRFTPARE